MSDSDIVRAWKDGEFRESLDEEKQAQIPEHPAGSIELTDADLEKAAGGATMDVGTAGCCNATDGHSWCVITPYLG